MHLDPSLNAFLSQMQPNSLITNPFSYLIDSNQGAQIQGHLSSAGYSTNLILLNSGLKVSALLLILLSLIIVAYAKFTGIRVIKSIVLKIILHFKFNVFMSYFLQTVFELSINSVIGIMFSELKTTIQVIDYIICCVILVLLTVCTLFMILVVIKKSKIGSEEGSKLINKSCGVFFEEFKDNSTSTRLFYVIFVIRRISIVLCILFVNSIIIQLAVSFCFALSVLFI
jgi:hypothetical protein